MGQLGRQLPVKKGWLEVVGSFCAESFLVESSVVSLVYALLYQLQKRWVDICVLSQLGDKCRLLRCNTVYTYTAVCKYFLI